MPPADVWLTQAESDLAAAARVLVRGDTTTYCHSVAKCQQTVEKAFKALVTAMVDAKLLHTTIGYGHRVVEHIASLRRLPKGAPRDIVASIADIMDRDFESKVRALEDLVPRRPAPGTLHMRNTEYPFQRDDGAWVAPAQPVFDLAEVQGFIDAAGKLPKIRQVVSLTHRLASGIGAR